MPLLIEEFKWNTATAREKLLMRVLYRFFDSSYDEEGYVSPTMLAFQTSELELAENQIQEEEKQLIIHTTSHLTFTYFNKIVEV